MSGESIAGFTIVEDPSVPTGEVWIVDCLGDVVGKLIGFETETNDQGSVIERARAMLMAKGRTG